MTAQQQPPDDAPPSTSWRQVELFGGAMAARLPACFVDVSDFRPVPDHQEVSS